MTQQQPTAPTRTSRGAILRIAAAAVLVASIGGFSYWFFTCPCDRTPGGYLLGAEAEEPITDWSFANNVELCQIQINTGFLPHSINLNCMATPTGALYLSCSQCDGKRWSRAALDDNRARIRLDGTVYPVTATRVTDSDELDRAWAARIRKLQHVASPTNPAPPPDAPRPDHWWSFRLESR